ncbi:MAG: HAD-IA family hydrolase [Patescibacteria group bacterium]
MIKAVIFDIDGVLLDSFEANFKFHQDLMIKNDYRPPTREEFHGMFHMSMTEVIKFNTKSTSEDEIKRIWEMGRKREVGYPVELLAMPEKAEKVVEKLSKSYILGIVTSRVRETLYESPRLAELQKHFKIEVSFQDTKNHKPHPEPLLLAAEKLGVVPMECVYIGDAENDIKAARAAGMKSILYGKDNLYQADAFISSFHQLAKIIASL